ncbi:DUF2584 domain-containing protein [Bacillus carboniphilus]|uniref:DUF2584 domain-containing protein n=1 Tax=Bacillus carboniphilus TaxID=86663 RepID=A0ABY9JZU0_9BACI|nr:DUF2584 domain-containing protein [Bacillus carboniphilus]WLR44303.1 DUF2584 domain-containing protein [Bacillus carboniphilus]
MGMPLELNTMIVTKGKEIRLNKNIFQLKKDGYRLYPLNIPLEVRKMRESEPNGYATITKLELEEQQTILTYELISLNTTN